MITNLLFFVAFLAASYVVSRLASNQQSRRLVPAQIKTLAARRSSGDTVR